MENWTQELLIWFDENRRDLPFRKDPTPYHVWISEIMAQQTRIEAMLPYYRRFMARAPRLQDLAFMEEEELMKLWQGLGYYSRARNLKKAAQVCMEQYGGHLPETYDELKKLPGIGDYTAGAVASIACGQRVAAIDGNVLRVFARLFLVEHDIRSKEGQKQIRALVEEALPEAERAGDFNQALMELGALVCIPKNPRCGLCPVASFCQARQAGRQAELPVKPARKERVRQEKPVVICVWTDGEDWQVRVHRRKKQGLLAGMIEFDEVLPEEENIENQWDLQEYTHLFTHREWHMQGTLVQVKEKDAAFVDWQVLEDELPLPSAFLPFKKRAQEILYG